MPRRLLTRVFAPAAGVGEDHVCGSENCMMGLYWASQKGSAEQKVRQVSESGGKLRVKVNGDNINSGVRQRWPASGFLVGHEPPSRRQVFRCFDRWYIERQNCKTV